jgi:hypothetical protein
MEILLNVVTKPTEYLTVHTSILNHKQLLVPLTAPLVKKVPIVPEIPQSHNIQNNHLLERFQAAIN